MSNLLSAVRRVTSSHVHDGRLAAEGAKGEPAAVVFPHGRHVGRDAEEELPPANREAGRLHLVEDEDGPDPARDVAEVLEEGGVSGNLRVKS